MALRTTRNSLASFSRRSANSDAVRIVKQNDIKKQTRVFEFKQQCKGTLTAAGVIAMPMHTGREIDKSLFLPTDSLLMDKPNQEVLFFEPN